MCHGLPRDQLSERMTYLMTRLHTSDNALDVGTHQCQRRRRVDICQSNFRGFAVEHGDESSTHHSNEPERFVLILPCGDLYKLSATGITKSVIASGCTQEDLPRSPRTPGHMRRSTHNQCWWSDSCRAAGKMLQPG
jgi:hypothetical protein